MHFLTPGAVILVTGATGGIGFEIASQAAAGGAVVGVHGSRPETVAGASMTAARKGARVVDGIELVLFPKVAELVLRLPAL